MNPERSLDTDQKREQVPEHSTWPAERSLRWRKRLRQTPEAANAAAAGPVAASAVSSSDMNREKKIRGGESSNSSDGGDVAGDSFEMHGLSLEDILEPIGHIPFADIADPPPEPPSPAYERPVDSTVRRCELRVSVEIKLDIGPL